MALKSLETLIRLQKTYVDEQRQLAARLQDNLARIDGQIAQMEIIKLREQAAAREQGAASTYGAFARQAVEQARALEKERQTAAQAVRLAQEKLSELFEEQKRYEIAEAQRIEREQREQNRRDTLTLDEIGAVAHERRRQND